MASTEIQGADASPVAIPRVRVQSFDDPFGGEALAEMERLLPVFIASRRWFRAKARAIEKVVVDDDIAFSPVNSLLVLNVVYMDGGSDTYLLPLSLTAAADDSVRNAPASEPLAVLATAEGAERLLYSAFANPSFRGAILSAIAENRSFHGRKGTFFARRTAGSGVAPEALDPAMDSAVSRAEQSNTSVIYGDKFILKLFRKIEEGVNPDVEVGLFLTEHGFVNTPAVVGTLEYRGNDRAMPHAAGLLGAFVPNRGDAWKYSLDSLGGFFARALATGKTPTRIPSEHPLLLAAMPVPADVQPLIGPYLESARLLGRRTAEMHAVLAKGDSPAFVAEPLTNEDSARLYEEMQHQADAAFAVLKARVSTLPRVAATDANQLLVQESNLRQRFSHLRDSRLQAARIRFHGDYHLGQVLYTGSDFMIIDFEGEPARPLEARREKGFALRDVAGMVRSFQYAAYAALFGQVAGVDTATADPAVLSQWSSFWYAWVSAAFLRGYFETSGNAIYLGPNPEEHRQLLDAFVLHKALYEVVYELNNRPDWVSIPLRGILSLIA